MKFLLRFPNLWFMILLIETATRLSCITSYVFSDMDECTSNYHICDNNAVCQNTEGSYTCSCKAGYTGDGKICSGEWFGVLLIAFLLKDDDNDDDDVDDDDDDDDDDDEKIAMSTANIQMAKRDPWEWWFLTKMANPVKNCQQWRKYNGESGIKITEGLTEI